MNTFRKTVLRLNAFRGLMLFSNTFRKTVLSLLLLVGATAYTLAQSSHLLTLGLRGGGAALLPQTAQDIRGKMGGAGALDIGYVWYMPVREVEMGIRTGVVIGYGATTAQGGWTQSYSRQDYLSNTLEYTTQAQLWAKQQCLYADFPVMMALRAKGVVFNVGLLLQATPWQQTAQQLSDPTIDAYYPAYKVHVTNELITGVLQSEQLSARYQAGLPTFGIGVGTEIGYEFVLPKGQIGLQAFFSCSVWNNYRSTGDLVIDVAPIADIAHPVPDVAANNALHSLIEHTHPLSFGIRLYYALEWQK